MYFILNGYLMYFLKMYNLKWTSPGLQNNNIWNITVSDWNGIQDVIYLFVISVIININNDTSIAISSTSDQL